MSNDHTPLADPVSGAQPAGQRQLGSILDPQVLVAAIGQAAAVVTAAAAMIYATGAISFAFRLWYDGVPVLPVLVQLPRSWSFTQAVTQLLPLAAGAGLLAIFTWKRTRKFRLLKALAEPAGGQPASGKRRREARLWLVSVALGIFLVGITLLFARYFWINPLHVNGVQQRRGGIFPRPWWNILIICLIMDTLALRLALHFLPRVPKVPKRILDDACRAGIVALAFIPIMASVLAVNAFPIVKICGPAFTNPGTQGRRFAIGSLIGVSGQYMYVAEVLTKEPRPDQFEFAAGYIAVIPLSEARLVAIGRNASCGQLAPPAPTG